MDERDLLEELVTKYPPRYKTVDKPKAVSVKEFTASKFKNECFACKYINSKSLRENDRFMAMMRIYTDNSSVISKEYIWIMIKRFYDEFIRPQLPSNEYPWTIDCIEEHFSTHSRYPTDEILRQISIKQALRNQIANAIVYDNNQEKTFDRENIKLLIMIDREIRSILMTKKDISNMIGYCEVLDY